MRSRFRLCIAASFSKDSLLTLWSCAVVDGVLRSTWELATNEPINVSATNAVVG
jgi:hypothetical protein